LVNHVYNVPSAPISNPVWAKVQVELPAKNDQDQP